MKYEMDDQYSPSLGLSLLHSVGSPGIADLTIEAGQNLFDIGADLLHNNILKGVPIVSNVVNGIEGIISIKDQLYVRKIMKFLFEACKITEKQKEKLEQKISLDPDEAKRAGEALLEILDSIAKSEKAVVLGKVFRAYVAEDMSTDDLVLLCEMVDRAYLQDLNGLENDKYYNSQGLVNSGIKNTINMRQIAEEVDKHMGYAISMGGMTTVGPNFDAGFSKAGGELRRILREYI